MSKIKCEKVDKENYKQTVTEELEDHKYLNMRTPYGIEQAANRFITGLNRATEKCPVHRKSKFRRKKKISWSPKLAKTVTDLNKKRAFYKSGFTTLKKNNIYNIKRNDARRAARSV